MPRFPSHLRGKGSKGLMADVDFICQRYNILPSEYVLRVSPEEHQFNVMSVNMGAKRDGSK